MLRSTSQAHWNDGNRVTPPKWLNFSGEFLQFSQILLAVTYLRTKFDEIWSKLLARVDCYVLSIDFDKLLYRECFFSCQDTRKKSCTVGTSRCAKRKSNCAGTEPQCPHGTEEYLRGSCTCHLCLQLCSSPFETMFPNYRFFRWVKTTISDDIPWSNLHFPHQIAINCRFMIQMKPHWTGGLVLNGTSSGTEKNPKKKRLGFPHGKTGGLSFPNSTNPERFTTGNPSGLWTLSARLAFRRGAQRDGWTVRCGRSSDFCCRRFCSNSEINIDLKMGQHLYVNIYIYTHY